jgi:hypothetical protein
MKTLALILSMIVLMFGSIASAEHEGIDKQDQIPEFTDPKFPFPRDGMFRMPALIAVGDGQTFVIRPDGLMQPSPYTFYANPKTRTTSLVVKFDPPYGPGIWCIISAGAEFQPARSGDKT